MADTQEKNSRKGEKKRTPMQAFLRDLKMIVIIVPLALFIKSNTVELFKIPTGSMEPTLYGANERGRGFGDHILVLRFLYGFNSRMKVPLINWVVPLPDYRVMLPGMRMPKAGEVVVFENPVNAQMDYIKRCAGTPGDRLFVSNGHLYVNGEIQTNTPAQASYVHYTNAGLLCDRFVGLRNAVKDVAEKRGADHVAGTVYVNGRPFREVARDVAMKRADFDPVTDPIHTELVVPEGQYFMLGDNSAHSADSRFWGFVPEKLIKGKAWCVYLPIKRIRLVE